MGAGGSAIGAVAGTAILGPGLGTLLGGAIGSLFGGGGRRARRRADQLAQQQRAEANALMQEAQAQRLPLPEYTIPSEVQAYLSQMNQMGREGLPGEETIRDNIMGTYAGAAGDIGRTADTSSGALGALSGLYGRAVNSIRDLGVQSAQVQRQNQLNAAQSQLVGADYADKAWEYNYNLPYQRGENIYWGLRDQANRLRGNATDISLSGIWNQAAMNQSNMNTFANMLPYSGFNMPSTGFNVGQMLGFGQPNVNSMFDLPGSPRRYS